MTPQQYRRRDPLTLRTARTMRELEANGLDRDWFELVHVQPAFDPVPWACLLIALFLGYAVGYGWIV